MAGYQVLAKGGKEFVHCMWATESVFANQRPGIKFAILNTMQL
jgi:hypothetical protein